MCYFIKKRNPKILMKVCNEISIFILNISIPRFKYIFYCEEAIKLEHFVIRQKYLYIKYKKIRFN